MPPRSLSFDEELAGSVAAIRSDASKRATEALDDHDADQVTSLLVCRRGVDGVQKQCHSVRILPIRISRNNAVTVQCSSCTYRSGSLHVLRPWHLRRVLKRFMTRILTPRPTLD